MSILTSIKKTIEYSQKYGGKLTEQQLFERLIGNEIYKKDEVKKVISDIKYPVLSAKNENKIKDEKVKKAILLANKISKKFNDILFIGITGSVAAGYPKKNSDIDLMVITKINKLWINRIKLRLFIFFNKIPHRKYGRTENKDEFCFNLWLDEGYLLLPKRRQNLRNAMDLVLMKPIINRNRTYETFIMANGWAKKYVAMGYFELVNKLLVIDRKKNKINYLDKIINFLVFWPQYLFMKRKIKEEEVGLKIAMFNRVF